MLCYLFYLALDITIISTSRYDYFNMYVIKFTLFDLTISIRQISLLCNQHNMLRFFT